MSEPSRRRRVRGKVEQLQLLSAHAAALQLGVNPRTAQKRAQRAFLTGGSVVQVIAGADVAPLAWWEELLCSEPIRRVRPRFQVDALEDEDGPWNWECMIGVPGDPEYDAAVREQELARRRFLYRQKQRRERAAAAAGVGE
jgi:hypothetical protein